MFFWFFKRVAIARAIVNKPSLLLADELIEALDEENSLAILDLFDNLIEKGFSIIVIIHDINVAKRS